MKYASNVAFLVLILLGWLADSADYPTIAIAVWSVSLVAVSVMLYRLREQYRAWYGALEFVIALAGFSIVLKGLHENYRGSADAPLLARIGFLFAAIYVMVRALDNIGAGLKKGSKLQAKWNAIFQIGG